VLTLPGAPCTRSPTSSATAPARPPAGWSAGTAAHLPSGSRTSSPSPSSRTWDPRFLRGW